MAKNNASLRYKVLVLLCLLTGIMFNILSAKYVVKLVSYYTTISNIVAFVGYAGFVSIERNNGVKTNEYYLFKSCITLGILLTALVYNIGLLPTGFQMSPSADRTLMKTIANQFVHMISPTLVMLDYFLFDLKGKMKWYFPLCSLVLPFLYIVYVNIYSACGGTFYGIGGSKKFAYFFLDYTKLGYSGVAKWIAFIALAILVIGYLWMLLDNRLGRGKKRDI